MVKATSIKVPKHLGQMTIHLATDAQIIDTRLKIMQVEDHIHIPILNELSKLKLQSLFKHIDGMMLTINNFQERRKKPRSLQEAIQNKIPPHLSGYLPHSMDIIGRVAIIQIPPEIRNYEGLVGKAILDVHKKIKTVLVKKGAIRGSFRLRNFKIVAGISVTETKYKEHGCIYHLDPTKVYFSPRLSHERLRIAKQVKKEETIIDMFAGVGPFSILIGKTKSDVRIYAFDLNLDAFKYLKKNIAVNRLHDRIIPLFGDARVLIEDHCVGVADRVIMNLPEQAMKYLDVACKALKTTGGILHVYSFEAEPNIIKKVQKKLRKAISRTERSIDNFSTIRLVKAIAPNEWQVAVDVIIH
jgi:tRNA (guanine37-N1)-methyltransferase